MFVLFFAFFFFWGEGLVFLTGRGFFFFFFEAGTVSFFFMEDRLGCVAPAAFEEDWVWSLQNEEHVHGRAGPVGQGGAAEEAQNTVFFKRLLEVFFFEW